MTAPPPPAAPAGPTETAPARGELRAQRALAKVKTELEGLKPAELDDGSWFHVLLRKHTTLLLRQQGQLVDPWRLKYPDLDDAALAKRIIRGTAGRAALIGGTAGALIPVTALASGGLGLTGAAALAFAELAALERLQIRMVLTLGELLDAPLANDRIHDVVSIYAHLLKIKGANRAAVYTRQAISALCRSIGLRFAQRAAVKLAVPIISVGVGGGMNYLLTRGLGHHAVRHFKARLDFRDPVLRLSDRPADEQRLVIGLMVLMASADGRIKRAERRALKATLADIASGPIDWSGLLAQPEASLIAQVRQIDDPSFTQLVLELLSWMAAADGKVTRHERDLLERVASALGMELLPEEVDVEDVALVEGEAVEGAAVEGVAVEGAAVAQHALEGEG